MVDITTRHQQISQHGCPQLLRPAASATGAATDAPPGERVTPGPTKTKPEATVSAAEGVSGFTAAFVIAGMLAVA